MAKELVRDGYLGDLPEDVRVKLMGIHKLIVDAARAEFKKRKYEDINNQAWAKSMLDEFLTMPTDKSHVGSVRVYQKGKTYKCMIQITGHVTNNRNTEDEELFHGFIRNLHTGVRSKVRRQYDVTLTCESEHGEPFEGFDIWLKKDTAKLVWEKFSDKKEKTVTSMDESAHVTIASLYELPNGLQELVEDVNDDIILSAIDAWTEAHDIMDHPIEFDETGHTELYRTSEGTYGGRIVIGPVYEDVDSEEFCIAWADYTEAFSEYDCTKDLVLNEDGCLEMALSPEYAGQLWKFVENNTEYLTEKLTEMEYHIKRFREKYQYNPADKTIIVDGEKYRVDDNINSPTYMYNGRTRERDGNKLVYLQMPDGSKGNPLIILSKTFFMLRGERAEAILRHEIAHAKQSWKGSGLISKDPQSQEVLQRYNDQKVSHLNPSEIEADRYAANRTSEAALRKGLRQLYRISYRDDRKRPIPGDDRIDRKIRELRDDIQYRRNQPRSDDPDLQYSRDYATWADQRMINKLRQKNANVRAQNMQVIRDDHREWQRDMDQRSKALRDNDARRIPELKPGYKGESSDEDITLFDPYIESEEYNTDMSVAEAKRTLATASRGIISDNDHKVTQYTANIYGNVITKNLLSSWAKGYNKFTITFDYKSKGVFEFKIPAITPDFIGRFIEGRESINGFLHRTPEIKVRMSPDILANMKNPDDAFNFFRAAIRYYDAGVNTYTTKLMSEVMKLNSDMKRLISTSKLGGLVSIPLRMLFVFDNVDISNKNTFKISQNDIKTVNQFIKNIYSRYAAPEKEKKQILADMTEMIRSLRNSNASQELIKEMSEFRSSVQSFYEGGFDTELDKIRDAIIQENIDTSWNRNHPDPQVRYLQEKTKVKKLKKIPADLVAYITIEAETIRDATDKMMIASYCISKIEIVEWYIELLDVGSNKYIVPHTKPYLESVRTQLLACYKKIMATPVPNPANKPLIDIQYPKGYEG